MYHITNSFLFFFFNDTATTEIYTLSLHDALPILRVIRVLDGHEPSATLHVVDERLNLHGADRKSTRLNSSHLVISYAVFCLKKKKNSHAGLAFLFMYTRSSPSVTQVFRT